ncbi:nuclear pore complex protein Nup50-like [Artemia franciscana]|uniref:nuclear pore complex protein Nup50-like n=1 Tax=Artemia franciscana TaxID=6661 RepID=UPI0032DAF907
MKRSSNKQLTQDNFDEPDSEDEVSVSTPSFASDEILKNRVIRSGKRRLVQSSNGGESPSLHSSDKTSKNIFTGFQGFRSTSAESKPSFNFHCSTPAPKSVERQTITVDPEAVFRGKVRLLNIQFLKWANEQNEKNNGVADLTPCMKNYETYLKELKDKLAEEKGKIKTISTTTTTVSATSVSATTSTPPNSFSFQAPPLSISQSVTESTVVTPKPFFTFSTEPKSDAVSTSTFNFGGKLPATAKSDTTSNLSFKFEGGAKSSTTASPLLSGTSNSSFGGGGLPSTTVNPLLSGSSTFSFGAPKPSTTNTFSFSVNSSTPSSAPPTDPQSSVPTADATADQEEDEEEKAQTFEKKDIKESDAFFEARSKLFYLDGNEFKSRGIGNLFLKNVDDKVQLIVRADNALGNLLLNIFAVNTNPQLEKNKKSVSLWCIPNPPISDKAEDKPKPTKFLFSFKDQDIATKFLQNIEKS